MDIAPDPDGIKAISTRIESGLTLAVLFLTDFSHGAAVAISIPSLNLGYFT
jgi:hypothetical protein